MEISTSFLFCKIQSISAFSFFSYTFLLLSEKCSVSQRKRFLRGYYLLFFQTESYCWKTQRLSLSLLNNSTIVCTNLLSPILCCLFNSSFLCSIYSEDLLMSVSSFLILILTSLTYSLFEVKGMIFFFWQPFEYIYYLIIWEMLLVIS